ncbi:MAG: inositol monophosphatase [Labilithrix sp.]|nr:inositol monophosphatase [Labilithrix sp.]MBX3213481.1 inositol monophosphatase [Labilithrix sp.]
MTTAPDPTTREGLEAILSVTREAAREAATLVLGGYRHAPAVEHKGAVDLVTSFDRDSEELLRRRLGDALPFAIVGEEQGGAAERVAFYVDPVDGTTNFVHGHPFWCVSVGLVIAGQPVLGVVISPPLGSEWFGWVAASGERRALRRSAENMIARAIVAGAEPAPRIVEEACTVSETAALEDSLLATGFPYDRRVSAENNFDAFVTIKQRCRAVRRCGSAALDLCLVADGTYEGYWERKLRPWDIAAGIAIVRAAGGRVTDFDEGGTFMQSGHVIATNGAIHDALTTELARVVPSTRAPRGA